MWNERQWRDRRIGLREIVSSWAIVALIVVSLAAWAGVRALMPDPAAPVATDTSR
jgi:hypothetical protein